MGAAVLLASNGQPLVKLGVPVTFTTTPVVDTNATYRTITSNDLVALTDGDTAQANDLSMNERYAMAFVEAQAGPFQGAMVGFSTGTPYVLGVGVSGQAVQEDIEAGPFIDSAAGPWAPQMTDDEATLLWLNRTFGKR